MKKLDLISLTKEFQKIQLAVLNEHKTTLSIYCSNFIKPRKLGGDGKTNHQYLEATLYIGSEDNFISYRFYDYQTNEEIFEQLDDFHKRMRKRPTLRNMVKELKNKYKD